MIDALCVFPDASLNVNSAFEGEPTPAACAAVAARNAEPITKANVRGLLFSIKSASYRANRLPSQAVFRKKCKNFSACEIGACGHQSEVDFGRSARTA